MRKISSKIVDNSFGILVPMVSLLSIWLSGDALLVAKLVTPSLNFIKLVLNNSGLFKSKLSNKIIKQFDIAFEKAIEISVKQLQNKQYAKILREIAIGYSNNINLDDVFKNSEAYITQNMTPNDINDIEYIVWDNLKKEIEFYPELKVQIDFDLMQNELFVLKSKVDCIEDQMTNLDVSKNISKLVIPKTISGVELIGREQEFKEFNFCFSNLFGKIIITGMGGIGKTEFVHKFIEVNELHNNGWVVYQENIINTFNIYIVNSQQLNENERLKKLEISYLINKKGKDFLLVIDDINKVDDIEWVMQLDCRIIIITRLAASEFEYSFKPFELGSLSLENAEKLFMHYYGGEAVDEKIMKGIIERSGRHTLVIELLAKLCRDADFEPEELLHRLGKEGFFLDGILDEIKRENMKGRKKFIDHIIMLYDISNIADLAEDAIYILKNISVLSKSQGIDRVKLKKWLSLNSVNTVNELAARSWLKIREKKVEMHNVISEVIRYKCAPVYDDCKILIDALTEEMSCSQYSDNLYSITHLKCALSIVHYVEDIESIPFLISVGRVAYFQGEYLHAERYYGKALFLYERMPKNNNNIERIIYGELAILNLALCKYEEAEKMWKNILSNEDLLYEDPLYEAVIYNNLGNLYISQALYREAENFLSKALNIFIKEVGEGSFEAGCSFHNLASLYAVQYEYEKAEKFYKKAMVIREGKLGQNHPETASTYYGLAILYREQHKYELAEQLFENALYIWIEKLGKNHQHTGNLYHEFAKLHLEKGDYDRAEELYKKALEIHEKGLGDYHREIGVDYHDLASLYYLQDKYVEAEKNYEKALKIYVVVLRKNHPEIGTCYYNLAVVNLVQKKYERAKYYFEKAIFVGEGDIDENPLNLVISYNEFAGLYGEQGCYKEAEKYYEKALDLSKKKSNYKMTVICQLNLSRLCASQERYFEAQKYCLENVSVYQTFFKDDQISIGACYSELAGLYMAEGNYLMAETYYLTALKICESGLGINNLKTETCYHNLGELYKIQGQYDTAEDCFKKAHTIRVLVLGEDHVDIAETYHNLGIVYYLNNNIDDAVVCLLLAVKILSYHLSIEHPDTKAIIEELHAIYCQMHFKRGNFLKWFKKLVKKYW